MTGPRKTLRKTESLAYPTDPLAALRDLQDLNAEQAAPAPSPDLGRENALQPVPATSSADSSETESEAARTPTRKRARRERTADSDEVGEGDPLTVAVFELLARPYANDPKGGRFTVSTVKMPAEVWERLGWVAKLSGQTKQDIIAEALKAHFEKVMKTG